MNKLYVESTELLDRLGYYGDTGYQLEKACKEANLYFSQDDMGNCYVSESEECEEFEEVEWN